MTRDQFKAALQVHRKSDAKSVMGLLGSILVLATPMAFVADRCKTTGYDAVFWIVLGVCFPVFAVGMFYFGARYPFSRIRELGLTCPACTKPLVGYSAQIVIATGNCGHCGEKVLEG